MLIAKEINNKLVLADYREIFPNTSFTSAGPSTEFLAENNAYPVTMWLEHDGKAQKLVNSEPYLSDGVVYTVTVADKTQEDLDADKGNESSRIRSERNRRLTETDWRFRTDMNPSQEWITYCQALRDVPSQDGFPLRIEWPEQPK